MRVKILSSNKFNFEYGRYGGGCLHDLARMAAQPYPPAFRSLALTCQHVRKRSSCTVARRHLWYDYVYNSAIYLDIISIGRSLLHQPAE
jgi:hypothetical protein